MALGDQIQGSHLCKEPDSVIIAHSFFLLLEIQMPHYLIVHQVTENLLTLHFALPTAYRFTSRESAWYSDRDNEQQQAALETLLVYLGYEKGEVEQDYGYHTKNIKDFGFIHHPAGIMIGGKCNVITILNLLFENPKLFAFVAPPGKTEAEERKSVESRLIELISRRIDDKSLSTEQRNKIELIAKKCYDNALNWLNEEPLVAALPTKASNTNSNDVLKHPFFQTISLLFDNDSTTSSKKFGLFDHPVNTNPEQKLDDVSDKYISFIPSCYLSTIDRGAHFKLKHRFLQYINPDKIKSSIPTATQPVNEHADDVDASQPPIALKNIILEHGVVSLQAAGTSSMK